MTMSTAVTSTPNLNELLAARVRSFLADAVPDEMVKAFAERAVKEFTEGSTKVEYGRTERIPPTLETLVRAVVHEELEKRVRARLAETLEPLIQARWNGPDAIDAAVDEVLERLAPAMMRGVARSMLQELAQNLPFISR